MAADIQLLEDTRIIVIVRGVDTKAMLPLAEALYEGGIRVMEVTMNSEGALDSIRHLQNKIGDRMWIGAGTVLDIEDAKHAIAAGAQFIVTPNMDEEVIRFCSQLHIPIYPGALTPTEIVKAWKAGAPAVKIFPSASIGMAYIKELQGPLSHIPMVAVGGVNADNIRRFMEIGCYAVGIGGSLVDKSAIRNEKFERITQDAARLTEEMQAYLEDQAEHG
jgi:2-dehydro-3-deoxyphosphogluconate aldolase/(4S)-4-hydroxy-2-oxoglutarate aldolase